MRVLSLLLKLAANGLKTIRWWFFALIAWVQKTYRGWPDRRRSRLFFILNLSFVVIAALMARPSAMQALGRALTLSEYKAVWTQQENDVLDNNGFPGARVIDWIHHELPEDSKFLVYRQAEFSYYVDQDWIYDFDPQIIDLYDVTDKAEAYKYLLDKGITHVFIPNYMPATLYNSAVVNLIGDPTFSQEVYSHSGMRLLELFKEPKTWVCESQPALENWAQGIIGSEVTFEASGKGVFGPASINTTPKTFTLFEETGGFFTQKISSPFGAAETSEDNMLLVWPNDYRDRIGLVSGYGPLYLAPQTKVDRTDVGNVKFDFEITGDGFLEIWIYEYTAMGEWSSRRLWDAVLDRDKGARRVEVQAQLASTTTSYRILISNGGSALGNSELKGLVACGVNYNAHPKPVLPVDSENAAADTLPDSDVTADIVPQESASENLSDSGALDPVLSAGNDVNVDVSEKPTENVLETWHLNPAESIEDSAQLGSRVYLGQTCHEWSPRCRLLNVEGAARNLLMRPNGPDGLTLNMPVDSGFTVFSRKPETSLRTVWQCRLARSIWFIERSPARDGFFEKIFLWFAKKQMPSGHSDTDIPARIALDMDADENTVVSVSLLWRDKDGDKSCYYLGEQVLETNTPTTYWDVPLPEGYKDLTLSFTTDHPLNEYINIDVDRARVLSIENVAETNESEL